MKLLRLFLFLLLLAGSSLGARAASNCVLFWNQEAIDATRLSRNPPPLAAYYFAVYHAAIFDAVNGIYHGYQGWYVRDPAPNGADMDAAVASAADTVLTRLWVWTNPRTIQLAYQKALAAIPDGPGKDAGIAWGKKVAEEILTYRINSGYDKPIPGVYTSTDPGKWRETPPTFRPPLLPFWPHVKPFVMTSGSQFRSPEPLTLGSKAYADELAFVNKVGNRDVADRTEYQTLCTPFWSDDLGTSTPPGHWNSIAQDIARRKNLSVPDAARLFALLNLAEADAGIQCWDTKYYYTTWRPETALREMTAAQNPAVATNPGFIPNMQSPSFPSYTSGHSTFSAAASHMIELFFGTDNIPFSVGSDGLPGVIHSFKTLSEARAEVGMSRVWGGIHTMTDNLEGQKAGIKVADWVYTHALQASTP